MIANGQVATQYVDLSLIHLLSFVGQQSLPPAVGVVTLILAYVFIIAAFVLDFWKIKKERVAYQAVSYTHLQKPPVAKMTAFALMRISPS